MTVPSLRPVRPLAFEQLQRSLGQPFGADFDTARQLVALVEAVAPGLTDLDRLHLGRLMVSTGHEIGLGLRRQNQ